LKTPVIHLSTLTTLGQEIPRSGPFLCKFNVSIVSCKSVIFKDFFLFRILTYSSIFFDILRKCFKKKHNKKYPQLVGIGF
jgi:hypothetical protein